MAASARHQLVFEKEWPHDQENTREKKTSWSGDFDARKTKSKVIQRQKPSLAFCARICTRVHTHTHTHTHIHLCKWAFVHIFPLFISVYVSGCGRYKHVSKMFTKFDHAVIELVEIERSDIEKLIHWKTAALIIKQYFFSLLQ